MNKQITESIYSKYLDNYCFDNLKALRDKIQYTIINESHERPVQLYSLGEAESENYISIMKKSNVEIINAIKNTMVELLRVYNYQFQLIDMKKAHSFLLNNKPIESEKIQLEEMMLCFIVERKGESVLYILKEYGINNRIPNEVMAVIKDQYHFSNHKYISLVATGAFFELLNHNDNLNDPSRGTDLLSIKDFFVEFFSLEEYERFKSHIDIITSKINGYYGLTIVKTLNPAALYNFRQFVLQSFRNYPFADKQTLNPGQIDIIYNNLFDNQLYKAITGKSDFATCFLTAEWLFSEISNGENIDFTVVSMGFFKAIELLLFQYVSLHTHEKDEADRFIYDNQDGWVQVTDQLLEHKKKYLTLGSLTGFFGYNNRGTYIERNKDLLVDGIDDTTYHKIIDILQKTTFDRNGYFHKDILYDFDEVKTHRDLAFQVFFIIFGAYRITNSDEENMGIIKTNNSGYYKLCEYMNHQAYKTANINGNEIGWKLLDDNNLASTPKFNERLSVPMYNYYDLNNQLIANGYPKPDHSITYDQNGEPIFSGFYIKPKELNQMIKCDEKHLPYKIGEVYINSSTTIPIQIDISQEEIIFEDGVFKKGK